MIWRNAGVADEMRWLVMIRLSTFNAMTHCRSNRWLYLLACLTFVVVACSMDADGSPPQTVSKTLAADAAPDLPPGEHTTEETRSGVRVDTPEAGLFGPNLSFRQVRSRQRQAGPSYGVESVKGPQSIGTARNPAQGFAVDFSPVGPNLEPSGEGAEVSDWRLQVRLARIGRRGAMREAPAVRRRVVEGNRIEYVRDGGLTEWYVNGPLGVEQGVEIAERPAPDREGPLVVEIAVGTGVGPHTVDDDTVALETNQGKTHLTYRNLFVRDADGESVPARMTVREGRIRLIVGDGEARYPLEIDPTFSSERVISDVNYVPESVRTADVDGDGDPDVLAAMGADFGDTIAWYENTGGSFGSPQDISTDAEGAFSIHTADVDGDGDSDILSAAENDNKIAWYENTGGSFGSQQVISTDGNDLYPADVTTADVDGDGDPDALSATYSNDEVAWYENTGGSFGAERVIDTDARGAKSVHPADVDGDGKPDLLTAWYYGNTIAWYRNEGGSFGSRQIVTTNVDLANMVRTADVDGDGDPDLLSASWNDDKVAWYENTGGAFGSQRVVTTDADGASAVHATDLDADGDPDLLSASAVDNKVAWYENTGGTFSSQRVITSDARGASSVHAEDLDGDGDTDVLAALGNDSEVVWYANQRSCPDSDDDGTCDFPDGCPQDGNKTSPGVCGCGNADTDADGDGTADCNDDCPSDSNKASPGSCGCGTADPDADSDGTADCNDDCPEDPMKTAPGMCGCGTPENECPGDAGSEGDTDAGSVDSGGDPDTGPTSDSGRSLDGTDGPRTDSGVDAGTDAGLDSGDSKPEDGCSCRSADGPPAGGLLMAGLILIGLVVRRRA